MKNYAIPALRFRIHILIGLWSCVFVVSEAMSQSKEQKEWRSATLKYVSEVNDYVRRGEKLNWEGQGPEPIDPGREHLAEAAMRAVREANRAGKLDQLRESWPPAHAPLIDLLEAGHCQSIPVVCALPDGSLAVRLGVGKTVQIVGDSVQERPELGFFGHCPNHRFFAFAEKEKIRVLDGWDGPEVATLPWPTGLEDLPEGAKLEPYDEPIEPTRLIPFPDGKRVLLVSEWGIYVLAEERIRRLIPTLEDYQEEYREDPAEFSRSYPSMVHGAVSRDGNWVAVGCQDGPHWVFDKDLKVAGEVEPALSYPYCVFFSADDELVCFESCSLYDGETIAVKTSHFPGLKAEGGWDVEDERAPTIWSGPRIHFGTSREGEFIVGDSNGYVRAFDHRGQRRWQQYVGSTIDSIDVSEDGKTMIVGSMAGFVCVYQLDAGKQAPHQIGDGNHCEIRRWVFWPDEEAPLGW